MKARIVSLFGFVLGSLLLSLSCLAEAADISVLGITVFDSYINPKGAFVNTLSKAGPADRGGILSGDVITAINGVKISNAADLSQAVEQLSGNGKAQVSVARNQGKDLKALTLTLTGPKRGPQNSRFGSEAETVATQSKAVNSPEVVQWTTFTDPQEAAFSLNVPAGWTIQGGSRRISAEEIRTGVSMLSPDKSMLVFFGDASIPIFTTPSPVTQAAGLATGSVYSPGYGQSMVIMPYMAGETFAANWGSSLVSRYCRNVQMSRNQARPSETQSLAAAYAAFGVRVSVKAGEAEFTCAFPDGSKAFSYIFASTEFAQTQITGLWDVKIFTGYIADQNKAAIANSILQKVVQSFAINPNWVARQQQTDQQTSALVARSNPITTRAIAQRGKTLSETSDIIVKGGEARSRARDNAAANYDEFAVRGTSTYEDPTTGDRQTLDNNYQHQYTNSQGQTLSTDSPSSPGVDWRELNRVPPGQ